MERFQELREMYDRGQTEEVLREIGSAPINLTDEGGRNLIVLKGWAHYRRKEYDNAHDCSVAAGNLPWARELMAYLCVYAPGYVNDEALLQIAKELGSANINVANAFVIRARADDCNLLTAEQVIHLVELFQFDTSVHAANLYHNAGRYFLAKPRQKEDLQIAVDYLDEAIGRYGAEKNFHHRAAANLWKSHVLEKLGQKHEATRAASKSVLLWAQQCKIDPTNEVFEKKCEDAKNHLGKLLA